MSEELEVLRDVTQRLENARISFMLTGSLAMSFFAQPRYTRDIDIVIELNLSDVSKFEALFSRDYYVPVEAIRSSISLGSMFNLIHNEKIVKVDFIIRKSAQYRQHEFQRRTLQTLGDVTTWVVSKEDLILSKLQWAKESGSEYQMRDVRNLVVTGCDRDYIDQWVVELDVSDLWQELKR